jgi:hypothetical protein
MSQQGIHNDFQGFLLDTFKICLSNLIFIKKI